MSDYPFVPGKDDYPLTGAEARERSREERLHAFALKLLRAADEEQSSEGMVPLLRAHDDAVREERNADREALIRSQAEAIAELCRKYEAAEQGKREAEEELSHCREGFDLAVELRVAAEERSRKELLAHAAAENRSEDERTKLKTEVAQLKAAWNAVAAEFPGPHEGWGADDPGSLLLAAVRQLKAERDELHEKLSDALGSGVSVALGIEHHPLCAPETLCCRCRMEAAQRRVEELTRDNQLSRIEGQAEMSTALERGLGGDAGTWPDWVYAHRRRVEELEAKVADCEAEHPPEPWAAELQARNEELKKALLDLVERVARARRILRESTAGNWGMLDTTAASAALSQGTEPKMETPDRSQPGDLTYAALESMLAKVQAAMDPKPEAVPLAERLSVHADTERGRLVYRAEEPKPEEKVNE